MSRLSRSLRWTLEASLSLCVLFAPSASLAQDLRYAYSPDYVVNDTPACTTQGNCASGRTMMAVDPNNAGSFSGVYWTGCSTPTITWLKGGGPGGPWGVETHKVNLGTGFIEDLDEKSVTNGVITAARRFFNADTLAWGAPRIPLSIYTWTGNGGTWYRVPLDRESFFTSCPTGPGTPGDPGGYPWVQDAIYLANDPWNPFRARDCRPGGDCQTEYKIDVIVHYEPTCCTPGEEYVFGRWTDPQTNVAHGLGFIAWRPNVNQNFEYTTVSVVNGEASDPCLTCP